MTYVVGQRIRTARESKGISQKKLGLILGLSDKAISAYESNRTLPPIDTLYKIAQELDQDITYFFINDNKAQLIMEKLNNISTMLEGINTEFEQIKKEAIKK